MQSQQQSLSPEVQAVLDLCEIQNIPLDYKKGFFHMRFSPKYLTTQRIETALAWIEAYKHGVLNATKS